MTTQQVSFTDHACETFNKLLIDIANLVDEHPVAELECWIVLIAT